MSNFGNGKIDRVILDNQSSVSISSGSVGILGGKVETTGSVNILGRVETAQPSSLYDAFSRYRVSNPYTLFEAKHSDLPHDTFTSSSYGTGSSITIDTGSARVILTPGTGSGNYCKYQSLRYMHYQPGKSQEILMTFCMNSKEQNVIKRIGYFDDENGIYLQQSGSVASMVIRSSVGGTISENVVTQDNWSEQTLSGTLDLTKTQILFIDFEWLGVGTVRTGFIIDGELKYVHKFNHANRLATVYMREPDLPVRWEVQNGQGVISGNTGLHAICATVSSEGGVQEGGQLRSANRKSAGIAIGAGQTKPVITIKKADAHLRTTVIPMSFTVISTTNANFLWEIIKNPVIIDAATSWTPLTSSGIVYDVSRTGSITGGMILKSGYCVNDANMAVGEIAKILSLDSSISGISEELCLAVTSFASDTYYGSIDWSELH